jgi:DNA invertase Pin-like site-specific DNA recombinase
MTKRCVCYYRVSTRDQERSGLGLAVQHKTVKDYLNGNGYEIVGEYTEVESGGRDGRPELTKAIRDCELKGARLIVSRLDRLSCDLHFITQLQRSAVQFTVAEMPDANELTIHLLATIAQHERKLISQRTKDALQAAKARGVRLGNPKLLRGEQIGVTDPRAARQARTAKADDYARKMSSVIEELQAKGITSFKGIADSLNDAGYRTSRDGRWYPNSVKRIIERLQEDR